MRKNPVYISVQPMYDAVVIGVSAGGLHALTTIIPQLPVKFPLTVIIVQHRLANGDDFLVKHLNEISPIRVKEAQMSEKADAACVYIAPAAYHLLIERNEIFSLSVDPPVNYAIPSIDILFESAAVSYQSRLIGIILTGANADGSRGLARIKAYGGLTIVQEPASAQVSYMPSAAMDLTDVDHVIALNDIAALLTKLALLGRD